jgi:hypothetical protein
VKIYTVTATLMPGYSEKIIGDGAAAGTLASVSTNSLKPQKEDRGQIDQGI